jgi:hypothetical protein
LKKWFLVFSRRCICGGSRADIARFGVKVSHLAFSIIISGSLLTLRQVTGKNKQKQNKL